MRFDSIKMPPIRLGLTRHGSGMYSLTRAGRVCGFLYYQDGLWYATEAGRNEDPQKKAESFGRAVRYHLQAVTGVESFRAAALRLARYSLYVGGGGAQVFENVTCVRVCVSGKWMTFAWTPRGSLWVFDDFSANLENPGDYLRALLLQGHQEVMKVLQPEIDKHESNGA